jgi:hypothetical protein
MSTRCGAATGTARGPNPGSTRQRSVSRDRRPMRRVLRALQTPPARPTTAQDPKP